MSERYLLMAAERAYYPVVMMARLLKVSRSGFYDWLGRDRADDPWAGLRAAVEATWLASERGYGARQVLHSLPPEYGATLYRVRKAMRELGIGGVCPSARKRTTIPDEGAAKRPDLLKRDFTSPVPTYKLVGDITYLRTGEGWLYLSTVIDLNTRMVVGWALSERMTAGIVTEALERARLRGYVAAGAIFHSDRGPQHSSRLAARWAREHDVRPSCGRTGSCHDNAVAESFFGTPRNEMCHLRSWPTRAEARLKATEFIESYYNRRRPHSSVGRRVPARLMEEFFERTEGCGEAEMAA